MPKLQVAVAKKFLLNGASTNQVSKITINHKSVIDYLVYANITVLNGITCFKRTYIIKITCIHVFLQKIIYKRRDYLNICAENYTQFMFA